MSSSDSTAPGSLRCDNIRKSFNGVLALRDVTLHLPGQGIIAIIGPNGAGKTTLINVLTGFVRPDSGSCRFGGLELTRLRPYQIARLGLARTFQDVRIVAGMSVVENVMLACPQPHSDGLWGPLLDARSASTNSGPSNPQSRPLDSWVWNANHHIWGAPFPTASKNS